MTLGDPADNLDVAQAARTFLDIGLEVVGGVVETEMPVLLFFELGLEEFARRPDFAR